MRVHGCPRSGPRRQISRLLRAAHPEEPGMYVEPENIHLASHQRIPGVAAKPEPSQLRIDGDDRRVQSGKAGQGKGSRNPW